MLIIMKDRQKLFSLFTLMCGLCAPLSLNFFGELYYSELIFVFLLILIIPDLFSYKKLSRNYPNTALVRLTVALLVGLVGYMIADVINYTETQNLMRGWSRQICLLTNTLSLTYLISLRNLNIWLYCISSSVSKISYYIFFNVPFYVWKIGYGEPITLLVVCLSLIVFRNSYFKLGILLFFMSVINLLLDYRSLSALTLIVALFAWVKGMELNGKSFRSFRFYFIVLFAISSFVLIYVQTEKLPLDFLSSRADISMSDRRSQSNSGRFSAITIAFKAIYESPLIGHGSWPKNPDLVREHYSLSHSKDSGFPRRRDFSNQVIPSHSQILQSWIEGGILGMTFFLTFIVSLILSISKIISSNYKPVLALYLFILFSSLIESFMSPFGGFGRLSIALAIAVICTVETSLQRFSTQPIQTSDDH
jgi:hypothetical protein